ncbi:MAG: transposase [Desulfuromonadales bacterium]|nr:transposase [Desulfuromonadales bacterium]
MTPDQFFTEPGVLAQRQYEALRLFFVEKKPAREVASRFGYTYRGFTTLVSDFRGKLKEENTHDYYFVERKKGKKRSELTDEASKVVIDLRKKYYSVQDIKVVLDSKGYNLCEKTIYNILHSEGFSRLPRRTKMVKQQLESPSIEAEKSVRLDMQPEEFKSNAAGILCLLPLIKRYGIDQLIKRSSFPHTTGISRISSILSFVALKASNVRRYTADDLWCMDRGMGLFAGLNVLPKAAWYTSYSHRVTSEMNRDFLKALHQCWLSEGLLSDTSNLDFTTIPYWGEDGHLENNWSGKRRHALASMLAVLAHDPDSGIIDYGDAGVMHSNESAVVLEFLDFYKDTPKGRDNLKYLVFDSKFTNYQNLGRLDKKGVKFVTIRRRGKKIVEKIESIPGNKWQSLRVEAAGNKKRTLRIYEEQVFLKGYNDTIRQVCITGHGKVKPAIIITNDFELSTEQLIRKYTRRWIVEKAISEQIEFFHLNSVSSSMVIKVDFDLTMSILTHNIYRLFALEMERYENMSVQSIYEKFIKNAADIEIDHDTIRVQLKKKRNLPLVLERTNLYPWQNYSWLGNKKIIFDGASYS